MRLWPSIEWILQFRQTVPVFSLALTPDYRGGQTVANIPQDIFMKGFRDGDK
jgi:hypothetical protein